MFIVQTFAWSMEFAVLKKSQAQHHRRIYLVGIFNLEKTLSML